MKVAFRSIGIGLFVAGMLLTLSTRFSFLDLGVQHSDVTLYEQEIASLKGQLKEAEQALQLANGEQPEQNEDVIVAQADEVDEQEDVPAKDEDENEAAVEATVYIYESMSLYDIGQVIEDEGIVTNGREVELYLSKPDYARKVQKGAFELHSNMSVQEIAKLLTGQQ